MTFDTVPNSISHGWTIGFWLYIENQASIGTNLLNVILTDNMVMSIGLDTNISSICNIYLAHNPNLANQTIITNLKTMITNLGTNGISATATFAGDNSGKWFYTRCAYSYDFGKMYSMVSYTNTPVPVITETPITFETRWKNESLDNHFKKFNWKTADKMILKITNSSNFAVKSVFIKNLYVFKDMIPAKNNIHYL